MRLLRNLKENKTGLAEGTVRPIRLVEVPLLIEGFSRDLRSRYANDEIPLYLLGLHY